MNHKKANPILSFILSLYIPGLGQIYNCQSIKAIVYLILGLFVLLVAVFTAAFHHFLSMLILVSFRILLSIISAFDATVISQLNHDRSLKKYNKLYFYILIIIIFSFSYFIASTYIRAIVAYPFKAVSGSMEPLIYKNDYFMIDPSYYYNNSLKSGDLIVFLNPRNPNNEHISRCIAIENEHVTIQDNEAYVNGKIYKGDFEISKISKIKAPRKPKIPPEISNMIDSRHQAKYTPIEINDIKVPERACFVLGDNRIDSYDSRYFGPVPIEYIIGKPIYIYYSKDKARIGKLLK